MNTIEHALAIADAESAVRNRPNDFAAFEIMGSAYFEADRLDEALTALQRSITLNPGTVSAFYKIGWIYYRMGKLPQAIAAYEQAIANDPHCIPAYDGLGWLYIAKLADFDQAAITYQLGLTASPADSLVAAGLGSTYMRMGQTENALKILEQSAIDHPDQAIAPSWLSYIYFRLKRFDDAAACCRREIELNDAHSPHRVLGFVYHELGRNDEAIAELERAVELEPHDYEARAALAKLYRASGNTVDAEYQYNTGKEMSLEDNEYGLACFHAVNGDAEKALDLLETACTKGQITPGWMRIDPELFFIQDEPRFQALVS